MSDTLTIDQAVDSLTSDAVENTPEAPIERNDNAALEGADIPGGDDQPPEANAAETPAEANEGDVETPATVVEAPTFWSAEGKALFASLPPEAQAAILAEENAVKSLTAKKLEGTAAEKKAAKAERDKFAQLTTRMAEAADKAESAFESRWAGITPDGWSALAQQDPAKYTALKAQYDAEQHASQQASSVRKEVEATQHADWLSEQAEKLQTLCPELVDPVHGEKNLRELSDYLIQNGAAPESLPHVGAMEMSIARKAMLYDRGVAQLNKPRQPAPTRPGLKPSGSEAGTAQQRSSASAMARLSQSGSIDDAVEVLLARK